MIFGKDSCAGTVRDRLVVELRGLFAEAAEGQRVGCCITVPDIDLIRCKRDRSVS